MNSINRKSAFPSTITHLLFIRLANYSLKFTSAAFRSPARAPCNPLLQSFILVTGNRRHPHQLRSAHGMAEQGSEDQVRPFSIPTYFTILVTKTENPEYRNVDFYADFETIANLVSTILLILN